jgi:GH24 family phage-related lysozyme (muramidase)
MKTFKQFLTEMAPPTEKKECDINGICKIVKTYESRGNEEKVLGVYKDSKGLPTIGHGHLITKESPSIFAETFPEEHKKNPQFGQTILSGKGRLTPEQADKLLERDVKTRIPKVQKLVPQFNTFSSELQGELASEYFRGMVGKSPKAVNLLNQGKFNEAATEYLNADEYRTSVEQGTGIAARMDNLAKAIKREGTLQRQKKPSLKTTQVPQSSSTLQNEPSR